MMKNIKTILYVFCFSMLSLISCETTELDLLENPNAVNPENLDPQFLFDNIQLSFGSFVSIAGGPASFTSGVTRQYAMTGSSIYESAYAPINFNGLWSSAYAGILQDINSLENFPTADNYGYHVGVSKIMKSYILTTLVDMFGDVPFEEALQGETIENPQRQDQAEIYGIALQELDAAIVLLSNTSDIEPLNDFYYEVSNTSQDSWIIVANTLKLRLLNNARLNGTALGIDINSAITAALNTNIIDVPAEDFQFNYGDSRLNPNTRHPGYNQYYENGATGYMSNYLMWEMIDEKGFEDPRLRYYFYRQDNDASNEDIFTLGCAAQSAPGHYNSFQSIYSTINTTVPFCTADEDNGYWGRDHGDDNGLPPDGQKRTVFGLYPVGGLFDTDQDDNVQNNGEDGLLGAGIQPIILSSYVHFMQAEIALSLGIGSADASLMQGMVDSMDKVTSFGSLDPNEVLTADDPDTAANEEVLLSAFLATPAQITAYTDFVMDEFTAAVASDKMNILMKEFHIATYGNSLEMYNAYRRTGYPNNMQPSLNPSAGDYYRSAYYSANSVNNNTNSQQAEITRQVFWDTNAAGFIN